MTEHERRLLAIVSGLLEYPDEKFFQWLNSIAAEISALNFPADAQGKLQEFARRLQESGRLAAQEHYVRSFDLDPAASLYLSWHRYGNDKGQGKAMAALNGLYRAAGYEPVPGTLPDYLPRMLEFLSVCDEWAAKVLLDGFGPEMAALLKHLEEENSAYAVILNAAFEPLRKKWPEYFAPRRGPDRTLRPMARPEPESALFEIIPGQKKKASFKGTFMTGEEK